MCVRVCVSVAVAVDLAEAVRGVIVLASDRPPARTHTLVPRPPHPRSALPSPPVCLAAWCAQDQFSEEMVLPLATMPWEGSGATYVVLARPPGSMALGRFACTLRFKVKEIDPSTGGWMAGVGVGVWVGGGAATLLHTPRSTHASPPPIHGHTHTPTPTHPHTPTLQSGEAEEDGYDDEYQLEDLEVAAADYVKPAYVPNFRAAWEALPEDSEMVDDYGLGQRESLQDAVEAVTRILGMAPSEGTDAVPPNARSHTVLLAGTVVGGAQALVRLQFGIDAGRNVAMKLASRSETQEVSEAIHMIIQEA